MTIMTLFQSACYAFGQDSSNARFSDDFYNALNDSQNEVANARKWGFLRTTSSLSTTDGTRYVALPSDFGSFYDVRGSCVITSPTANSGTAVQIMTFEEWTTNHWESGTTEGTPQYVYVMGDNAYFSPVPDATYVVGIIYYKRPAEIKDTSDTLTIPARYHELLRKMIFRRLQYSGYSSIQDIQITDADVQRLMGQAASDDVARFGSFTFNLNSTSYKRRTV